MTYATVDDLKLYLGKLTGTDDSLLFTLLARATDAINDYTRRRFAADTDETRVVELEASRNPHDPRTLMLPDDLCAIRSITVDGEPMLLDVRTKPVHPPFAVLMLPREHIWGAYGDVAITGRWAYSQTPPPAIAHACIRLAGYYYRLRDAQVFDTTAIAELGQLVIPKGIPADVKVALKPYVRMT